MLQLLDVRLQLLLGPEGLGLGPGLGLERGLERLDHRLKRSPNVLELFVFLAKPAIDLLPGLGDLQLVTEAPVLFLLNTTFSVSSIGIERKAAELVSSISIQNKTTISGSSISIKQQFQYQYQVPVSVSRNSIRIKYQYQVPVSVSSTSITYQYHVPVSSASIKC